MSETKSTLALTIPRKPFALSFDLRLLWEDVLQSYTGREVLHVHSQEDDNGFPCDEDLKTIKAAGALVVASYNTRHLELDKGVLHHMSFAQEFGKPVFCQSPLEDVIPPYAEAFDLDRAEVVIIGNQVGMINEKLGEI